MIRRFIIPFALFILSIQLHAQSEMQVNDLAEFCKVWGFLKYYHPYPSSKDVDWDKVLIYHYDKVKSAHTQKAELNAEIASLAK